MSENKKSNINLELLEFDMKVRGWASFSSEGFTMVFNYENPYDSTPVMINNLITLMENRKEYAIRYLAAQPEQEELREVCLQGITYINKNIKQLLRL